MKDPTNDIVVSSAFSAEDFGRRVQTAREIHDSPESDDDLWLWEGKLERAAINVIVGPSDTGKSSLVRQLALAISGSDAEFLGSALNLEPSMGVLYVASEDGLAGTRAIIRRQCKGLGREAPENLLFMLDSSQRTTDLQKLVSAGLINVLIDDTWSNAFDGLNASDSTQVRRHLLGYLNLCNAYGLTVILIHHLVKGADKSKPDKSKVHGSQSIEAMPRVTLDFRLNPENSSQRILTVLKANRLPQDEKGVGQVLNLDGDSMLFSDAGEFVEFGLEGEIASNVKYDRTKWIPIVEQYWATFAASLRPSLRETAGWLKATYGTEAPKYNWLQRTMNDFGSISKQSDDTSGTDDDQNDADNLDDEGESEPVS